eukprot:CAMPEP_0171060652 /NCGR_PEP_ID=MMETSP0766_2-20121228/3963_1 /TAXON_ID=439317 /ORGANISM="Gambierdiscus australes, Strain CAWD 149" /LENGTH=369 /DNA_ID=CAMNT_0011516253 /DNA_START=55 /DNA_END=1164 /DNA_ORIENTATION=+
MATPTSSAASTEAPVSEAPPTEPIRDKVVAAYGGTVEITHHNSLWRRDLVYPDKNLRLEIRPMTPDDDLREADFFAAQTVRERIMRFMGAKNRLLPHEVRHLTHINYDRDFAIVAVDRSTDALAGIARYCREQQNPSMAEVAVAVLQRYQRLGLARYLVSAIFDAAKEYGVQTIIADILRENTASRRLFDKVASQVGASKRLAAVDSEVYTYHFILPQDASVSFAQTPQSAPAAPPVYVVDDSRHPRSLWRHDLVFQSGLRVDVRPADPDDRTRVQHFVSAAVAEGDAAAVGGLAHIDFMSGFTLVAIDMSSDEFVGVAHFHRGADWSRMNVVTAPNYRGLGIADFLAAEVLRAAESEVVPPAPRRAAL